MIQKTIFITGATDGIGLETAKLLAPYGHHLLIHGRNKSKLYKSRSELTAIEGSGQIDIWEADFARPENAARLAKDINSAYETIDVLINNAGVYKTATPRTPDNYDLRFAVNLFAPVILTQKILPRIPKSGRVINLSSAAQSPVNIDALKGAAELGDMPAYAQSKLAFTIWTQAMADAHAKGPLFIAVNPGSFLNTNMVKLGWGGSDKDIGIGAKILVRAALDPVFEGRTGQYFDNDSGNFAPPHPDAANSAITQPILTAINDIVQPYLS